LEHGERALSSLALIKTITGGPLAGIPLWMVLIWPFNSIAANRASSDSTSSLIKEALENIIIRRVRARFCKYPEIINWTQSDYEV
jgi:hypothetical protein